ncbi:polyphosphate kinase 2 family protein [Kibdelosporangium philippinense]|uniref:Polyphosphate kinase 2 family protein n=1 Tax=Kibdelosporangium philippinense TaxID=211113 RepID=A0ABS8ZTJ2_9PSEU|nr:polyphosphate kinase 2 family protein [Kibdelosporangium philippinense]MCE7009753.1 polyphosphate kinase 2 family protein [Kibdelosporangium philippinense]
MGKGSVREALRPKRGKKSGIKPGDLPVGPTSKSNAAKQLVTTAERLDSLQEALYAGASASVLLVLQGMDTSGKGGTIRHACGLVNPQGLKIHSFKKPTRAELRHDFLWRVRKALPTPGMIGVFDRSHYEDVLIARVDSLVPQDVWEERYALINAFEQELVDSGVTIIKCFLHISPEEQRKRLIARLERPQKHWKYNPADLDARSKWDDYQAAYSEALTRCDTDAAPWYVVPSDHKWYRNWAVSQLLLETLEEMDPQYPEPGFDVAQELKRVKALS